MSNDTLIIKRKRGEIIFYGLLSSEDELKISKDALDFIKKYWLPLIEKEKVKRK